jgi:hypothetical protein
MLLSQSWKVNTVRVQTILDLAGYLNELTLKEI